MNRWAAEISSSKFHIASLRSDNVCNTFTKTWADRIVLADDGTSKGERIAGTLGNEIAGDSGRWLVSRSPLAIRRHLRHVWRWQCLDPLLLAGWTYCRREFGRSFDFCQPGIGRGAWLWRRSALHYRDESRSQ